MSVEATGGPDNWTLSCTGSCGEGECEERSVTIGGRNIRACACTLSNLETACCQVVLDSDGNPAKIGNCPACPASGQCTLDPPGDPQTVSCDR
jgi:hypothetical protein